MWPIIVALTRPLNFGVICRCSRGPTSKKSKYSDNTNEEVRKDQPVIDGMSVDYSKNIPNKGATFKSYDNRSSNETPNNKM